MMKRVVFLSLIRLVALSALVLLSARPPVPLSAQVPDTARAPVAADSTHRIRPLAAFWRSLVLPGWGQAATGRSVTGAVFVTWEGVTAMMTLKAQAETHYLKESGSKNLSAKRQEVQDWLVLWIFNHLFSGAEAYVSAHLQDFPRELKVQAVPGGIRVSVLAPRP